MDVGSWLLSLGLGQCEANFPDNAVDAEVLVELSDNDLTQLGVLLGHLKRLLKAIAELASADKIAPPKEHENLATWWSRIGARPSMKATRPT